MPLMRHQWKLWFSVGLLDVESAPVHRQNRCCTTSQAAVASQRYPKTDQPVSHARPHRGHPKTTIVANILPVTRLKRSFVAHRESHGRNSIPTTNANTKTAKQITATQPKIVFILFPYDVGKEHDFSANDVSAECVLKSLGTIFSRGADKARSQHQPTPVRKTLPHDPRIGRVTNRVRLSPYD